MKKKIGSVTIDYEFYKGADLYSDGSVEDELLKAAETHSEEQLETLIEQEGKWAFLYHFSKIRHNIVRELHISREHNVLEIGSGCGAITGALAQKAGKVTCIELSEKRSLINANRNSDYSNIEILVGNFADIEPALIEKYDYITLIGVLEYGALYLQTQGPYLELLKRIKSHLKPDGKIIIAIENKFGLKYWAGCREDHTGAWFDGIENYQKEADARTFTRKELEVLFQKAGLSQWEFYYPHPDYKLPFALYTDKRLPQSGELVGDYHSYDTSRLCLFDEGKAFDAIIENGLYPVFANSFLIIVGQEAMVKEDLPYRQYPGKITIPRQEEYSLQELIEAKKKYDGYLPIQIFWDTGEGFCEEKSRILELKPDEEGILVFDFTLPKESKRFRIDPGNDPCTVEMKVKDKNGEAVMIETNGNVQVENTFRFENPDPWVVYEKYAGCEEISVILQLWRLEYLAKPYQI